MDDYEWPVKEEPDCPACNDDGGRCCGYYPPGLVGWWQRHLDDIRCRAEGVRYRVRARLRPGSFDREPPF